MNRLRECREKAGLTQKQVAITLKLAGPSVSNWESGKTKPSIGNLKKLADLYDVTTDFLLGKEEQASGQTQTAVRVPVLGTIPAGIPLEAITDIIDWEEIPASMARGGQEYFALQISGYSMYPEYRDGDIVIVRKQETCETGQDVVAMVNSDDATFKRFKQTPQGVMLQALNPECDSYIFTAQQIEELPVRILGVVVELRRKV